MVLNHASSFPTVSSCAIEGASTAIVSFVPGPTSTGSKPDFLNSATASAAASYSDDAASVTEWDTPTASVNEEVGTDSNVGEEKEQIRVRP